MNTMITDLPPEMIGQIFDHLHHRERLLISITCKAFRKLVFSPKFCKCLVLRLRSVDDVVRKLGEGKVSELCRNAMISCEEIPDDHKSLLIDYLRNAPLESLSILTVKETAKWILEHLTLMKMLETLHLNLRDCESEILRISHPTLKKAIFERIWAFEIDCPNLSAIDIDMPHGNCIHGIKSLRGQLQSLTLNSGGQRMYTALSAVEWDNLRELQMMGMPEENAFKKLLKHMPRLRKLKLYDEYTLPAIGKEIGIAKFLSELVLVKMKINPEFNKSLEQLTMLGSLTLINIHFDSLCEEQRLVSSSINRLKLVQGTTLPQFPNLTILDLQCRDFQLCTMLKELCIYYPKLEHLSIGVPPGQVGVFHTESEYPDTNALEHLNKLKFLKSLRMNRIATETLNWDLCDANRLETLRFDGCSIGGITAQQMVNVFKHLRQLIIEHCYLRHPDADVFELVGNCAHGLRSQLPGCAMSFYDCSVEDLYDVCSGGNRACSAGIDLLP